MDRLIQNRADGDNEAIGCGVDDAAEGFCVIDTLFLLKASCDKTGLMLCDSTFVIDLSFPHPSQYKATADIPTATKSWCVKERISL